MSMIYFDSMSGVSGEPSDILQYLNTKNTKAGRREEKMRNFEANNKAVYSQILSDTNYPTYPPIQTIDAALCTGCCNIDIVGFEYGEYETRSSMRIINDFPGAGYLLECRCCKTQFRFCARPVFPNKRLNIVSVSKEFCRDKLGFEF